MFNKVLTAEQLREAVATALTKSHMPLVDVLLLLLSHRAGLRMSEIADLRFEDVSDGRGGISKA